MENDILYKFGHTSNLISKNKIFIFGGANNIKSGNYFTTNDSLLFDLETHEWTILKNEGNIPKDRAAHAVCTIQNDEVLLFGGAQVKGNLCEAILYQGVIKNDKTIFWKEVIIDGLKPRSRYGHIMVFSRPYIIIFGGSSGNSILNETWILNLKENNLKWLLFDKTDKLPPSRVYHSADICKSGKASGMIIIFGGRDKDNKILNDIWGLRQHRTGIWEWIKGPINESQYIPQLRFQHKSLFLGSLMFNVGGKYEEYNCNETLDIYDTELNNWVSVPFEKCFRHTFWISNGKLYFHGGLDQSNRNINCKKIKIINILDIIPEENIDLKEKIIKLCQFELNISNLSSRSNSIISNNSHDEYIPNRPVIKIQYPNQIPQELPQNPEIHKVFWKKLLQPQTYVNLDSNSIFPFSNNEILQLVNNAEQIIKEQPILLNVQSPVKIFGDIHGQYSDLMRFFDLWDSPYLADEDQEGDVDNFNYIFLGDYVDRGLHSLETICLLLALKCMYPNEIHLIRGNHEDRYINNSFGFLEECEDRLEEYDSETNPDSVFNRINDLFEYLPLSAIVDNKILCIHGGIGETFKSLDQIRALQRPIQVVHEVLSDEHKLIVDILWSDPTDFDEQLGIQPNIMRDPQGTGNIVKFGPDIINKFLKQNNLIKIIRAHECVMDGIERFAGGKLITVFSATDYCGKHKNAGAVLYLTKDYGLNVKLIYPDNLQHLNWNNNDERPPTPPKWRNSPRNNI